MDKLDPETVERFRNFMAGGQLPLYSQRSFYDKEFLMNMHDNCLASHDSRLAEEGRNIQKTSTPAQHSSPKVELVRENQITIATLVKSIDQVLHGKFLLCRVIAPAYKMTALSTLVDDPAGVQAVRLSLYNFTADVGYLPVATSVNILPVGTVLAIKNPWFKKTMDGGLSVRCDNPDDVVVLDDAALMKYNPDLKWEGYIPGRYAKHKRKCPDNDNDWKRRGNEYFVGKRYLQAIEAYTNGLKLDSEHVDLLANRAAAYLNVEKFELALADTEQVLTSNPTHLKGIFRKTKALWGLQKFEEAQEFLQTHILPKLASDKQVQELWSKTNQMISQFKFGHYPMAEIALRDYGVNSGGTITNNNLDWAEFKGPVKVKPTGDVRGRGMFATEKIQAGQLILASKAFGLVSKNKGHDLLFSANMETKLVSDASQVQLVASIAHKLRNNPERGRDLYSLFAGPKLGSLNPESDDYKIVDMKRIDSICTYNAFGFGSVLDFEVDRFSGLWITPSLINHNCIDCNCCWTVYGNFLLVRAFKDIEPEEEVLITYTSPSEPYAERKKLFNKYGFTCNCNLCEYDRAEPKAVAQEKDQLLAQIAKLDTESMAHEKWFAPQSIYAVVPMIDRLSLLRSKHNLFMPPILDTLAGSYMMAWEFAKAASCLERCYFILEHTPLRANIFRSTVNLVAALVKSEQRKKAKHWVGVLKKLAICCWGTADILSDIAPLTMGEVKKMGIAI